MKLYISNVLKKGIAYFISIGYGLLTLFPMVWFGSMSIKTVDEYYAVNILPSRFTLEHFSNIFNNSLYVRAILNTIIISSSATLLSFLLGISAAYAFARYRIRRGEDIALWILTLRMIPPIITVMPIFLLMNFLHLIDTRLGIILAHTVVLLPFMIWMMRAYFREIPKEIEEAAMIDGCTRIQAFLKICLPICKTGLVATAIFCMIFSWSEFPYALIITRRTAVTIPVCMYMFRPEGVPIPWGEISVFGTISILPLVILTIFIQKHLLRGLTLGAVKG